MSQQPAHTERSLSTLETEQTNPATSHIDLMTPLEIARVINNEDARVALAIQPELPKIAQAMEGIAARMRQSGRLIYIGAGTSGRLGILDASECPPTFNSSPEQVIGVIAGGERALTNAIEGAEDDPSGGEAALAALQVTANDSVVGLAASGRTPYVLGAMTYARARGALTIGIACTSNSPLEQAVEIMIAPIVGPEVISGSTRLKAGSAQKMVLNMLSTGAMILLGKTYGNLMVDVRATNYKLVQRAMKIVQLATGCEREQAVSLLERAGGDTKVAIFMGLTNVDADIAREQLTAHGQILRSALNDAHPTA
ncbi:N-acetylmuramic acid 6-phosphate etherase [Dictyobacter aurantiacus]|uniref:N-acetylmuramic acid 6-phosphate etherase n=1 Tax=Dictyobacter aurantiacus TaxID=1936993 RepID=A0A401Z8K5_9CHLR|nr:N-acetylmuramic acid 6-phosphate etherase [Dictyobacter aurantiacus]GCE03191.1 N-acetylmuramic acid 6-phosphate etherase [Dictyobacter aurantiacus]